MKYLIIAYPIMVTRNKAISSLMVSLYFIFYWNYRMILQQYFFMLMLSWKWPADQFLFLPKKKKSDFNFNLNISIYDHKIFFPFLLLQIFYVQYIKYHDKVEKKNYQNTTCGFIWYFVSLIIFRPTRIMGKISFYHGLLANCVLNIT